MNRPVADIDHVQPRQHVDLIRDLAPDDPEELRIKFDLARKIALEVEDRELS
jgi:hypothetical protein